MKNQKDIKHWLAAGGPRYHEINGEGYDASCFYSEVLGFCGCGDPEAAATFLVQVLRNIEATHHHGIEWLNEGLKYLVQYWIDDRGWTEHGVSIDYVWLTDDGKLAIRILEAFIKLEKEEEEEYLSKQQERTAMTHTMARPREVYTGSRCLCGRLLTAHGCPACNEPPHPRRL